MKLDHNSIQAAASSSQEAAASWATLLETSRIDLRYASLPSGCSEVLY